MKKGGIILIFLITLSTQGQATGAYSTVMGYSTKASGHYSTAMGAITKASGAFTTAMGYLTVAIGDHSIAMFQSPLLWKLFHLLL